MPGLQQKHLLGLLWCCGALGCAADLPPYGEAIVFVDTDLAVPRYAARLRVDTFAADGTWHEWKDIARPDPATWPVSFSVFTREESRPTEVLLRLRVYPEGMTREYRGERYQALKTYQEPFVAATLGELCEQAPSVRAGDIVTLRRSLGAVDDVIAQADSNCEPGTSLPVTGARVQVESAGTYRFAIVGGSAENPRFPSAPRLLLRQGCMAPTSQLGCAQRAMGDGAAMPSFDLELEPGEYFLIHAAKAPDPIADFDVRIDRVENWSTPELELSEEPRLFINGVDETPGSEPQPNVTVDRLVKLTLEPGRVQNVSVTLHGACVGTMAHLGESLSCVDEERTLLPAAGPQPGALQGSVQGNFSADETCADQDSAADVVCVPGGMFTLGDGLISGEGELTSAVPERVARVGRFWMDRQEVTVARFREALDSGLDVPEQSELRPNEYDLATVSYQDHWRHCTWSELPRGREDYPLNCIGWDAARAFCQWASGDLPSEAQWEYAATAAGRDFESRFAWAGSALQPSCGVAAYALSTADRNPALMIQLAEGMPSSVSNDCFEEAGGGPDEYGVRPVKAHGGPGGDVTTLGLLGMAGSLSEWVLDEAQPYGSGCWTSAPIDDPICRSDSVAPLRVFRGGSWQASPNGLRAALRGAYPQTRIEASEDWKPYLGFRCAYAEPPPSDP